MDVIAEAIWFGIRVTVWLIRSSFEVSCYVTKLLFETLLGGLFDGVLRRNVPVILLTSAILWTPVGMLVFSMLNGGSQDGLLLGLIVGPIWGGVAGMRSVQAWEQEAMFMDKPEEPELTKLLDRPLTVQSPASTNGQTESEIPVPDLSLFDEMVAQGQELVDAERG